MKELMKRLLDPLLDYFCECLRKRYEKTMKKANEASPITGTNITATNSTVVISSTVSGSVISEVQVSQAVKTHAQQFIASIKKMLDNTDISQNEEINEILDQLETEIAQNKKPQKGLLTALRVLCSDTTYVIPLVSALIELFSFEEDEVQQTVR